MKHSEFKRRIEELGFEVNEKNADIEIIYKDRVNAWVSKDAQAVMKVLALFPLGKEGRVKLFDILVEYARTPIEDRKDEKKYSIHPFWTSNRKLVRYDYTFSNFGYEDDDSFGLGDSELYSEGKTRVFNEPEAIEICDFFGWDFDKVAEEVEDDE